MSASTVIRDRFTFGIVISGAKNGIACEALASKAIAFLRANSPYVVFVLLRFASGAPIVDRKARHLRRSGATRARKRERHPDRQDDQDDRRDHRCGSEEFHRDLIHWRIERSFGGFFTASYVVSPPVRDLLLCAKHLFVAARGTWRCQPVRWPVSVAAKRPARTALHLAAGGALEHCSHTL